MRLVKTEEMEYVAGGNASNSLAPASRSNPGLSDLWQLPEEITLESMTEWLHTAFSRIADILNSMRIR